MASAAQHQRSRQRARHRHDHHPAHAARGPVRRPASRRRVSTEQISGHVAAGPQRQARRARHRGRHARQRRPAGTRVTVTSSYDQRSRSPAGTARAPDVAQPHRRPARQGALAHLRRHRGDRHRRHAADRPRLRLDRLDGTTLDIETGDGTLAGRGQGLNAAEHRRPARARSSSTTARTGSASTSVATGAAPTSRSPTSTAPTCSGGATVAPPARTPSITVGSRRPCTRRATRFSQVVPGARRDARARATSRDRGRQRHRRHRRQTRWRPRSRRWSTRSTPLLTTSTRSRRTTRRTKTAGALASDDATLRACATRWSRDRLRRRDGTSLAGVGIQIDRTASSSSTRDSLRGGVRRGPGRRGQRVHLGDTGQRASRRGSRRSPKGASDSATARSPPRSTGADLDIKRIQDSIADWDDRLALRQDDPDPAVHRARDRAQPDARASPAGWPARSRSLSIEQPD